MSRPDRTEYYLGLAIAVSARAECKGFHVGAVLVGGNRVLSAGYNGAPEGWGNCSEGGVCPRCDDSAAYGGSGHGYDKCICVHAEMNAIAAAARYGIPIDGATAYVTHQPCFTCAKELVQAGIARVYYTIELPVADEKLASTQNRLMGQLEAVHIKPDAVRVPLAESIEQFTRECERAETIYGTPVATESAVLAAASADGSSDG